MRGRRRRLRRAREAARRARARRRWSRERTGCPFRPVLWSARGALPSTQGSCRFRVRLFLPGHGDRGPVGESGGHGDDPFRQRFGLGEQRVQRTSPVEAKGVAILPNQFREHGSAPQARPQAVGEGPYVSAGTANDSEGNVRKLNPEDFRTRNFDGLDFERGFFPLPGQLVEGLTLMLGR